MVYCQPMMKLRKILYGILPTYDKTEKNYILYIYCQSMIKLRKILYGVLQTYEKTEKNPVWCTANL